MTLQLNDSITEQRVAKAISKIPISLRPDKKQFLISAVNSYIDVLVKEKVIPSVWETDRDPNLHLQYQVKEIDGYWFCLSGSSIYKNISDVNLTPIPFCINAGGVGFFLLISNSSQKKPIL